MAKLNVSLEKGQWDLVREVLSSAAGEVEDEDAQRLDAIASEIKEQTRED